MITLGAYTFSNAKGLETITMPNTITSIGEYCFSYAFRIKGIVIPNQVTSIGNNCFQYNYSLLLMSLPNSVQNLGDNLCMNDFNLKKYFIPKNVSTMGNSIVGGCSNLTILGIAEGVQNLSSSCFSAIGISQIILPLSILSLGGSCFADCYAAIKYDFSNFTQIPTLGSSVFQNINSNCRIIVPDELYEDWKTATNWSSYASKIIKASEA